MDRDIDLTFERKFSKTRSLFHHNGDKTFLFKRSQHYLDKWIKRSSLLPWNNRKLCSCDELKSIFIRSYEDELSDEFGGTLRITEDNTLLSFISTNILVLEDFFMEAVGKIPYSSINICMNCGRKTIKHNNSFMFSECTQHEQLPRKWRFDI